MSLKTKDTAISLFGVISSQITLFACFTLIARHWKAEELGSLNLSLSLGMLLGAIMAFRYELSCVQDDQKKSYDALIHTLIIAITSLLFLYLIVTISDVTDGVMIATFSATFFAQQASSLYLSTLRKYTVIAVIKNISSLGFAISIVIFICLSKTPNTFEIYTYINLATSILLLCTIVRKAPKFTPSFFFFSENIRFPKYTLPATILSSALIYSLPIIIPILFGELTAGFFAVTQRFGFFPVSLTAQSISGIFRRELVASLHDKNASPLNTYKSHAQLLAIAALLYVTLGNLVFGQLIELLLGGGWEQSVTFFHILSPLYALQTIYIPLSQVFVVTHNQKTDLIMQMIICFCVTLSMTICYVLSIDSTKTLILFSAFGSTALLIGLWRTYKTIISLNPTY